MAKKKKREPMLFSTPPTTEAEKFNREGITPSRDIFLVEPPLGGWDSSYVPGYSDIRHFNDLATRDGKKLMELAVRLQWARWEGEQHNRDLLPWLRQGYEFVVVDQADKARWFRDLGYGFPPAARVDAQGYVRRDDTVLMFCDAAQAAKNLRKERDYQDLVNAIPPGENLDETLAESSTEKVQLQHGSEVF